MGNNYKYNSYACNFFSLDARTAASKSRHHAPVDKSYFPIKFKSIGG